MRGQKLIPVKGVYSLEKWTKPNPVMSTENRPVDISSVHKNEIGKACKGKTLQDYRHFTMKNDNICKTYRFYRQVYLQCMVCTYFQHSTVNYIKHDARFC